MKKWFCLFLLLSPLFCLGAQVFDSPPTIAVFTVLPLKSEEAAAINSLFTTAITYYLEISQEYTVIGFGDLSIDIEPGSLKEKAAEFNLDRIILANLPGSRSQSETFELYLYDRATDDIIYSQKETLALVPVSEGTIHEAIRPLVENLVDLRSGWGAIDLTNRGSNGTFSVSIDSIPAGSNIDSPLPVPKGDRTLLIQQSRPFGPQILSERNITVPDGKSVGVSFAIPGLTDLEQTAFASIEEKILANWDSDRDEVEKQLEASRSLLIAANASELLQDLQARFSQWETDYKNRTEASEYEKVVAPEIDTTEDFEPALEIAENVDESGTDGASGEGGEVQEQKAQKIPLATWC